MSNSNTMIDLLSPQSVEDLTIRLSELEEKSDSTLIDDLLKLYQHFFDPTAKKLVPDHIIQLNQSRLYLNSKKYTSLPSEISRLINLEELLLDYNHLTFLPAEIGLLPKLKVLTLRHNQLKTLPKEIGDLKTLEYLIISSNLLKKLPKTIKHLQNLQYLALDNNQLRRLPKCISHLTNLKELYLEENPMNKYDSRKHRIKKRLPNCYINFTSPYE